MELLVLLLSDVVREHSDCGNILQMWEKAFPIVAWWPSVIFMSHTYSGKGISCIRDLNRPICDGTAATHTPTGISVVCFTPEGLGASTNGPHPIIPDKHDSTHIILPPHCPPAPHPTPLTLMAKLRLICLSITERINHPPPFFLLLPTNIYRA